MFEPSRRVTVALVACLLLVPAVWAAKTDPTKEIPAVSPSWTVKLESPVLWQQVTPLGNLIVETSAGLFGIDPLGGSVTWSHRDLRDLAEHRFRNILNTPYVMVATDGADDRAVILDAMDGRILFDSSKSGIDQVLSLHLLPRSRTLLLFGLRSGHTGTIMSLVDVDAGKVRWTNDDILAGQSKLLRFAAALVQAATDSSGILGEPLEIGEDAFVLPSHTGLYRVNTRDGSFDWEIPYVRGEASGVRLFTSPDRPEHFFVGAEETSDGQATSGMVYTWYSAHRIADGAKVWDKPVKIRGSSNEVVFLDEGLLISSAPDGNRKLKLVDYASGTGLWGKKGKGLEVAGSVIDHAFVDGGLLLVMGHDSAWTNKGVEYHFNIVDPATGTLRFGRALKVKGRLLRTEVLPRGVLYVTTSEINFLDPTTGRPLNKPIVSDGTLVTVAEGERIYAFSQDDGALYALDRQQATAVRLSKQKVVLGDRDTPDLLEVRGERIVLSSSQNIVAFGRDGSVQLQAHHPAPRRPAVLRALLMANAVRAAMASASAGIYSGALAQAAEQEEQDSVGHVIASELSHGYARMSEGYADVSESYFKAANARFKASAVSQDSVFMMVRLPEHGLALARVSKETGEIIGAIDLGRDKEPSYQVDVIGNRVYYRAGANEIAGYAF